VRDERRAGNAKTAGECSGGHLIHGIIFPAH
jgi:hypothetical protein